jgi:hypothetical protein
MVLNQVNYVVVQNLVTHTDGLLVPNYIRESRGSLKDFKWGVC